MCHVCRFICYLCVESKLMINTRSLSNQALKSARTSLLSSRCWPWGVFIGAGQALQHGEVRDTNFAWVRPADGPYGHTTSLALRSGLRPHTLLLIFWGWKRWVTYLAILYWHAESLRGEITMHVHFQLLFDTEVVWVVEIFPHGRQRRVYPT